MDADPQPPNSLSCVSCFGVQGREWQNLHLIDHTWRVRLLWTIAPAELLAPCSPEKLTQGIWGCVLHGMDGFSTSAPQDFALAQ